MKSKLSFLTRTPHALAALRISLSCIQILKYLYLVGSLELLYGKQGLIQGPVNDYLIGSLPKLKSLLEGLTGLLGVSSEWAILILFIIHITLLINILIGYKTKISLALVLIIDAFFLTGAFYSNYGVDRYFHALLFYLVFSRCHHVWSIDAKKQKIQALPAMENGIILVLIQAHFCLTYLAAGFYKAIDPYWWTGEAVWRALMIPQFNQFDFSWMANYPYFFKLACIGTIAIELLYPVLVWFAFARKKIVLGVILMHIFIGLFLGLYLFSLLMIAANICLFLFPEPEEWANKKMRSFLF